MIQRITTNGFALNTRIEGSEDAPWIVLSNSLGATMDMWQPQMAALTRHFRVLRYDTRGHGGSDTPDGTWEFRHLTNDVIALMDHFEIETAAFMGLSMGAMTGLGLALDYPQRFTRIICADGRADAPAPFQAMWDERIAKVQSGGLEAIVDGTIASWFTPEWVTAEPEAVQNVRAMILGNPAEGYLKCCTALKTLDYLRHLPQVTRPILYLGGDQDKGAAPDVMSNMARHTPNASYEIVTGAAHLANINQPETFNRLVVAFLTASAI